MNLKMEIVKVMGLQLTQNIESIWSDSKLMTEFALCSAVSFDQSGLYMKATLCICFQSKALIPTGTVTC
jgi:hypothetical protein